MHNFHWKTCKKNMTRVQEYMYINNIIFNKSKNNPSTPIPKVYSKVTKDQMYQKNSLEKHAKNFSDVMYNKMYKMIPFTLENSHCIPMEMNYLTSHFIPSGMLPICNSPLLSVFKFNLLKCHKAIDETNGSDIIKNDVITHCSKITCFIKMAF